MARLPKFLNVSLLRRMRLELPAAKVVLIAFSATLAIVGVGAFVATLPTLTAGVAPAAPESESGAVTEGAITDQAAAEAATADAAATTGGGAEASGVAGAGAVGVSSRPPRGNSSVSSSSASNSGSGSAGSSDSTPSGGASSGSSSGSGSGSGSGSSSDSGSDSGGGSSENDDPFNATPTEADEQNFHSFLCGWYNKLGDYEAMAAEGNSDPIWGGYIGVRNYTHSNYSKWCGSWGKLVAAYRCLASYAESDEESGKESYYLEYQSYKAAVNL